MVVPWSGGLLRQGRLLIVRDYSLCEFPARDAFASWLRIHVIDRLTRLFLGVRGGGGLLIGIWLRLARGDQALRERVLVDVMLIVELGHGEAGDALGRLTFVKLGHPNAIIELVLLERRLILLLEYLLISRLLDLHAYG